MREVVYIQALFSYSAQKRIYSENLSIATILVPRPSSPCPPEKGSRRMPGDKATLDTPSKQNHAGSLITLPAWLQPTYWVSRLGVVVNSHAGSVIRPATNILGLKARSGSEQPCRECNQANNQHTGSQG